MNKYLTLLGAGLVELKDEGPEVTQICPPTELEARVGKAKLAMRQ